VSTRYLLPCQCGEKIPVEAAQAGQIVQCPCGRNLEVPTMLRLRFLEAVQDEVDYGAGEGWEFRQGLTLVGAVVALAAVAGAVYFHVNRPKPPAAIVVEEAFRDRVEDLTLVETHSWWEELRFGLYDKRPGYQEYHDAMKAYHIRLGVTLVILGLATTTTIAGLVVILRARSRET